MPIGVNLLDWRDRQRRRRRRIAGSCLLGAAALAVAVTGIIAGQVAQTLDGHRRAVAELEQAIDGLAVKLTRVEALERDIATLRRRLDHKTAIRTRRRAIQAGLAAAVQSRPRQSRLRRIVITPEKLSIEGLTRQPTDAAKMARRLERQHPLQQADVVQITPNPDAGGGQLGFRLRAEILTRAPDHTPSSGPGGKP